MEVDTLIKLSIHIRTEGAFLLEISDFQRLGTSHRAFPSTVSLFNPVKLVGDHLVRTCGSSGDVMGSEAGWSHVGVVKSRCHRVTHHGLIGLGFITTKMPLARLLINCVKLLLLLAALVPLICGKWTRIELPEGVGFEVGVQAEAISLLAFACDLLRHHVDIYLLGNHVRFFELVTDEVVGDAVGELEGPRRVVIVLGEEQVSSLVLLLGDLAELALV